MKTKNQKMIRGPGQLNLLCENAIFNGRPGNLWRAPHGRSHEDIENTPQDVIPGYAPRCEGYPQDQQMQPQKAKMEENEASKGQNKRKQAQKTKMKGNESPEAQNVINEAPKGKNVQNEAPKGQNGKKSPKRPK